MKYLQWMITLLLLSPIVLVLSQTDSFDPIAYPDSELEKLTQPTLSAPKENGYMLSGSERIGEGQVLGPEDLSYNPKTGYIYTGCRDGWVSRVRLRDSVVEKWVNTSGQPLGIVHGLYGEVIVADADKGLLNISKDGTIEVLTDEAGGQKFKLTNAVDIARDGTLYFTDASFKYTFHDADYDILEGSPHGRFLSYNPSTKQTKVLLKDLYFANGVTLSADKTFVIFCETPMRRCTKYYIEGEKKGSVEIFIENLPGLPDNIRYDGKGRYWIALPSGAIDLWTFLQKSPFLRKAIGVMKQNGFMPAIYTDGGVVEVDLNGNLVAHYHDPDISMMTTGIKIGKYLYCGFGKTKYILRLNLLKYPAIPSTAQSFNSLLVM